MVSIWKGLDQQKLAASAVHGRCTATIRPCHEEKSAPLDWKEPTIAVKDYAYNETRYRMLVQSDEKRAEILMKAANEDAASRWNLYKQMSQIHYGPEETAKE